MKQKRKVILVIIDGLNNETAITKMGFMQHLVENNIAKRYKINTELPTLSRPLYETILTGTPPHIHGIVNNKIVRKSYGKSIFELAKESGLKTAAAAYYWISELYNNAPFDLINDREQYNENQNIQYGKFYFDDAYPDTHLFIDGEILRKNFDPDLLLFHPMGIDYIGHLYGSGSKEYQNKAIEVDSILSMFIPTWLKGNYQIIITSDHGMNHFGNHGGIENVERQVPLWTIGESFNHININIDEDIQQIILAPLICELLHINKSDKMLKEDLLRLTFCE